MVPGLWEPIGPVCDEAKCIGQTDDHRLLRKFDIMYLVDMAPNQKRISIAQELAKKISERNEKIVGVALSGSTARKESDEDSDIDMVTISAETPITKREREHIYQQLKWKPELDIFGPDTFDFLEIEGIPIEITWYAVGH